MVLECPGTLGMGWGLFLLFLSANKSEETPAGSQYTPRPPAQPRPLKMPLINLNKLDSGVCAPVVAQS